MENVVAAAFGLARPAGGLVPLAFGTSQTWTLDTADGRVLVKQVDAGGWRDEFERAMVFERRVLAAGIPVARPLPPVVPALGWAVRLDGLAGFVRAYEWVDGRPLAADDDVAGWLGDTLARLHRLEPAERAGPEWYHLEDPGRWQELLAEGERQDRRWAPLLREHLPDVLAVAGRVADAFDRAGDHVMTHRDVEPWNVLMTGAGPVLIDWDSAGPDSARLETAHAAVEFARRDRPDGPDPDAVRRTVEAYTAASPARPPAADPPGPGLLARRVGLRLGRLAGRLDMTLGRQAAGPLDLRQLEATACERIRSLPTFTAEVAGYAALLDGL